MRLSGEMMTNKKRWLIVVVYALAMAWVESAVVYYLRTMIGRIEPYQPNPLPIVGGFGRVELIREVATMLMLLTIGMLAGGDWRRRLGYAAIAFGVWDIFYYVFLRYMCDWPHTLLDWDILFLIPLPWWGPVLAPVCIALLMIIWGTVATQLERRDSHWLERWRVWSWTIVGVFIALYVFMADSLRVAGQGTDVLRNLLPSAFNWPLFLLAIAFMAVPIIDNILWHCRNPDLPDSTKRGGIHEEMA